MNYQHILDKLPSSWEDVTLQKGMAYLSLHMELPTGDEEDDLQVGLNNIVKTIAVLADLSEDEVKQMPVSWVNAMAEKTAFMNVPPEPKKESYIKWKSIDEFSYDDFLTFLQFSNEVVDHWPTLIKKVAKDKLRDEEVLQMSMVDVHTAFFFAGRTQEKINETYREVFSQAASEKGGKRNPSQTNTLQEEIMKAQQKANEIYGWYFFARRLAVYLNMSMPDVMQLPAMDVFGYYMVMNAEHQLNGYTHTESIRL